MSLRNRLLLLFGGLAAALLLAAAANYAAGARGVEAALRGRAEERAARIAYRIDRALAEQGKRLFELGRGGSVAGFLDAARAAPEGDAPPLPDAARAHLLAFFEGHRGHVESITCFDREGRPRFRVAAPAADGPAELRTDVLADGPVRPDAQVWEQAEVVRSPLAHSPAYGASLLITAPVPAAAPAPGDPLGALVLEIRLHDLIKAADEGETPPAAGEARARHTLVALDNASGVVVYHTNRALRHQPAAPSMPYFEPVERRMRAREEGGADYVSKDGGRGVVAIRQVKDLGLSVAAAEDYTAAAAPVRRAALWGGGLAAAAVLAGLALVWVWMGRAARNLRRVSEAAQAVAAGDFNRRVETGGMTGALRELAESFNQMAGRLRAHITTTSETRQFESFMRLSAMLSHDLKNAITGLSMLVSNMEKHIHREEFRADAVSSLREATDKLRRLASRLSEPIKSLSGEYRRDARPTDLVAVIRRVLAANVEPHAPLYELDARLPAQLVATVEPARLENVVENLVLNATDAMGAAGGRLTVEAGELDGGLVFFSVADTGAGMDEEFMRARLFRPFATTKTRGIGLGLYTCREVVEAHGGRLEVESKLGVGTRFRVVLPSRLFTSGDPRSRPRKGAVADETGDPGS